MVKKMRLTMRGRNRLIGLAFFSPWIIGFLFLTAFPMLYSIVISFSDVRIKVTGTELNFVGLDHYRYALLQDAVFPTNLMESLFLIAAGLPIVMVFSLVIALLLNRKFPGRALFRAVFFLPVIIMSGPVLTQLVQETDAMRLSMDYGILRRYFSLITQAGSMRLLNLFMASLVRILWFSGVQIIVSWQYCRKSTAVCTRQQPSMQPLADALADYLAPPPTNHCAECHLHHCGNGRCRPSH